MIALAFVKQIPPEDVGYIKKLQKDAKNNDPFYQLSGYYTVKYGKDFGIMYLSAILGGKKMYKITK